MSRAIVLFVLGAARLLASTFKLGAAAHDASYSGLLGWDARWYEEIAAHGYENLGNSALRFFPLLPVLARSLRAVPGMTAGISVVIVANVACLAAFAALYRLVVVELGDEACARRAVWLLALAPTAFVLVMGYAESLLLLTSLVTFLGLRQRRYALAICAAFAAGLCRPVGMLLAIPAAVEVVTSWRVLSGRERVIGAGAVLAAPAGAAAYLGWAQEVVGSFLLPLREQLSRSRRGAVADPFVTFARDANDLVHFRHLGTAEHAFWAVVLVVLAVFIVRRLPAAYGWYTVAVLAVVLTATNLESLERYGLGCFPFVMAVAMLTRTQRSYRVVVALSGSLLVAYAMAAFLGKYVP
ncbi:MAG: mannosyltransferase family protein [Acidimicrobiales bacterium]